MPDRAAVSILSVPISNPPERDSKPGSIGMPIPGTIVEILSLEDRKTVLQLGETGEICIRGPQVMLGYWEKPDETKFAMEGGRFHTGDIGTMDGSSMPERVARISGGSLRLCFTSCSKSDTSERETTSSSRSLVL